MSKIKKIKYEREEDLECEYRTAIDKSIEESDDENAVAVIDGVRVKLSHHRLKTTDLTGPDEDKSFRYKEWRLIRAEIGNDLKEVEVSDEEFLEIMDTIKGCRLNEVLEKPLPISLSISLAKIRHDQRVNEIAGP